MMLVRPPIFDGEFRGFPGATASSLPERHTDFAAGGNLNGQQKFHVSELLRESHTDRRLPDSKHVASSRFSAYWSGL